ncbi:MULTISPECIES: YggT family protein [Amycolatopsis]|uniref:YggT family protein n=1 Tax=Amycolatopsis dendrobii TaxID=2760662 RepID=A0A7W3ZFP0_9PSEU|nr:MULTISPECIES: YggT family protein [Amycolatopsis]MBB1159253.1 YggT family protein [Amycolatopsis dendrobii]UKD58353.1 YggT family protein [Amycolatopsis sp. FU40]
MSLIGTLVGYVLTVFIVVLVVRMVLDWTRLVATGPAWLGQVRRISHRATEPVIAPVRRVLPPIRAGGVGFDLAFTVVFFAALVVRGIAFAL